MSIARQQTNRKKEFIMTTTYNELLGTAKLLRRGLMDIDSYSEEAYQLLEKLIDELDYQAEEEENEF